MPPQPFEPLLEAGWKLRRRNPRQRDASAQSGIQQGITTRDIIARIAGWAPASRPATLPPIHIGPEERPMAHAPQPGDITDRNLALELVRVTEAAALAASR